MGKGEKAISFRITDARFTQLKKVAVKRGMAPGVMARVALFEMLERLKKDQVE